MKQIGKRVYNNNFFKYWGDTVPLKNNLSFYSKNRVGSTVVNKIDDSKNGKLVYNPLTDIIDLSKYTIETVSGWRQITLKTIIDDVIDDVTFKLIDTAVHLNSIRTPGLLADKFIISQEIDLIAYSTGKGWSPITTFTGIISGNGNNIINLKINNTDYYSSLFGVVIGAKISNISIVDCDITSTSRYCGALIGYMVTEKCIINNCSAIGGSVSGELGTGGLIGYCYAGEISNCYSSTDVTSMSSSSYAGGFIGVFRGNGSILTKCYSTGKVTIGMGFVGSVYDSYSCTKSYWDTKTSGQLTSACGVGKTTNEMKLITPSTIYIDWDFTNTWAIDDSYPYLRMQVDNLANPISNSRIVNNYDGYILMPSDIEIESGKPLFNRDDTDIYNQDATSVETGYVGDGTGGESSYYWHISELNTATILSYMNNDYKNSWFVKNTFETGTYDAVTVKEILAYDAPITDVDDLSKLMKYLKLNVWYDSQTWDDNIDWID